MGLVADPQSFHCKGDRPHKWRIASGWRYEGDIRVVFVLTQKTSDGEPQPVEFCDRCGAQRSGSIAPGEVV